MSEYDFSALNDKEFEALVADLLSEEWGVHVERFKPGKDGGVDGRFYSPNGGECVVQCKHWAASGLAALQRHLEGTEAAKVKRLKPERYVLATSVPLSRRNKSVIRGYFSDHVQSDSDVLGQEDINALLARHSKVERRHFKLWLSSTTVLEEILHAAIVGRSRSELEEIRAESATFVTTRDHARAMNHLGEHRILVLTGEPGIGKTTLARQLILEHVLDGFQFVMLEGDVSEAEGVFREGEKQVFYMDDFLGRTYLAALQTSQDSHITAFIKRVSRDPKKRFVLTSRTNILNQGAVLSDLLASATIAKNTYELRIGELSEIEKAHILYNHLWHSQLGASYIREIYLDKRYHDIIGHDNFNPRLVAFIVDRDKASGVEPSEYWSHVTRTLDNPKDVWEHFFTSQMSHDCRDLVALVVLNGTSIGEDALRDAFFALPSKRTPNTSLVQHEFGIAIRHSVGSVLNRTMMTRQRVSYSLFNPSVADYMLGHLATAKLWEYYALCLRTNGALSELSQLRSQPFFGEAVYRSVLGAIAARERGDGCQMDSYGLKVAQMLAADDTLRTEHAALIVRWISADGAAAAEGMLGEFLRLLLAVGEMVAPERYREVLILATEEMYDATWTMDSAETVSDLFGEFRRLDLDDAEAAFREQVLDEWQNYSSELVDEEGWLVDYYDPAREDEAEQELWELMGQRLSEFGIRGNPAIAHVCSGVDVPTVIDRNIERSCDYEPEFDSRRDVEAPLVDSSEAIDDLFGTDAMPGAQ